MRSLICLRHNSLFLDDHAFDHAGSAVAMSCICTLLLHRTDFPSLPTAGLHELGEPLRLLKPFGEFRNAQVESASIRSSLGHPCPCTWRLRCREDVSSVKQTSELGPCYTRLPQGGLQLACVIPRLPRAERVKKPRGETCRQTQNAGGPKLVIARRTFVPPFEIAVRVRLPCISYTCPQARD
jgi:hypothetical protein